jgi:LuxR family maltose regulon positive regulatory protein
VPVITLAAPPGYGKTTLMAQWAQRTESRVAWLSCDDADNDPVVLLSALAVALSRIGPVDPAIFSALASSGADITVVPRFVAAVASVPPPVTVLVDHTEAVTSRQCLNTIAEFALRLPPGWQLVLASRNAVPLPTARLRAQGGIFEVTAWVTWRWGHRKPSRSWREQGSRPTRPGFAISCSGPKDGQRGSISPHSPSSPAPGRATPASPSPATTSTWATTCARSCSPGSQPREASFLARTSVLDRMCGSLCDAILEQEGSGAVLEQMEARNLLVLPLDRHREWYRYHHLLRDLLRSELQRQEPSLVADLHFRAAAWFEANSMPEQAIGHAQAAGDYDRVARLILQLQQPVWASGRVETVLRWMEWLGDVTSAEHYGAIAVHGSLIFALLGRPSEAERWAAAAERASAAGILPDGSTMEATLAYLRAILCRKGIGEMRRDAQLAWEGLSPASPYRATMLYTEGVSFLLEGDPTRAGPILARALDLATASGSLPLAGLILAEQCGVAAERNDWAEVTTLAEQAAAIVENGHFGDYWTSALVYAWASRAAAHRGDVSRARFYLGRASRLRPLLTYALPVVSAQALLEMTRAYITLADPGGAAAVLAQAHDILQQRPDLGVLPELAGQLQAGLATGNTRSVGASSLTAAELRLLPLLSTHLSYAEIGERLYVSKNTVKTQAYSAYRKLGVSSRSEAVVRTRELGLDAL